MATLSARSMTAWVERQRLSQQVYGPLSDRHQFDGAGGDLRRQLWKNRWYPFFVGSSRTGIVPVSATQLQLGINDGAHDSNSGSFLVCPRARGLAGNAFRYWTVVLRFQTAVKERGAGTLRALRSQLGARLIKAGDGSVLKARCLHPSLTKLYAASTS